MFYSCCPFFSSIFEVVVVVVVAVVVIIRRHTTRGDKRDGKRLMSLLYILSSSSYSAIGTDTELLLMLMRIYICVLSSVYLTVNNTAHTTTTKRVCDDGLFGGPSIIYINCVMRIERELLKRFFFVVVVVGVLYLLGRCSYHAT